MYNVIAAVVLAIAIHGAADKLASALAAKDEAGNIYVTVEGCHGPR